MSNPVNRETFDALLDSYIERGEEIVRLESILDRIRKVHRGSSILSRYEDEISEIIGFKRRNRHEESRCIYEA